MKKLVRVLAMVVFYAAIAFFIVNSIYTGGRYPTGSDTMCHIYKGEQLFRCIKEGNFYPLYDQYWYNGVQMMRYWAPLPVYVLALCNALSAGDVLNGYLLFVAAVFFLGAIVWMYIGARKNRFWLGSFIGILWFFMPNNLFALFEEGNLPRALSMIFLPLIVYLVHEYMVEGKWKSVFALVPVFVFTILCHTGYAGMIALGLLVFCIFYGVMYKNCKRVAGLVLSLLLSFVMTGIWLVPSLIGGISSTDSSQVMKGFFQDALISLNPFLRNTKGGNFFYFGLAAFVLCIFGVIAAKKKTRLEMWTALVIFFCTTTSMYTVLVRLPGSQYLWMLRFISIALCMILYGLLVWKSLKNVFLIAICGLLVLDTIPSLFYLHSDQSMTATERLEQSAKDTLIWDAHIHTNQRAALLDASTLGAYGQYQMTAIDGVFVNQTFGAGWQSASTAANIVKLNEALSYGYYSYLFDYLKLMGNDIALIQKKQLKRGEIDVQKLMNAAIENNYQLIKENEEYLLFQMPIEGYYGVVSEYSGIAIGEFSQLMCYVYPDLLCGPSNSLDDYSYEELSQYKVIFLSGFTYSDKTAAEKLLYQLADAGVQIVIAGDGLPIDRETGKKEFMGVLCQNVSFENGYPVLYYDNKEILAGLFVGEEKKWNVTYFLNLDKTRGHLFANQEKISFAGHVYHDNISFIGLNLPYHVFESMNENARYIMDDLLGKYLNKLPKRTIYSIEVAMEPNGIKITSPQNDICTTLAFHDIFSSNQNIYEKEHLLYVNKGQTWISFSYPYLWQGIGVSVIGVIGYLLFWNYMRKKHCEKHCEAIGIS